MSVSNINASQQPQNPTSVNGSGNNAVAQNPSALSNIADKFEIKVGANLTDIQSAHYVSVSDKTEGKSFFGKIWQGIKNIAHNIKAFATSPMPSAFNIYNESKSICETVNRQTKEILSHPREALKSFPMQEARKLLQTLGQQLHDINEIKVTGHHNGDCGKVLQAATDVIESTLSVLASVMNAAGKAEADEKRYNQWEEHGVVDEAKETLASIKNTLNEILKTDPHLQNANAVSKKLTLVRESMEFVNMSLKGAELSEFAKDNSYAEMQQDEIRSLKESINKLADRIRTESGRQLNI